MEIEQGTLGWHRQRLGKITGSEVYKLLGNSKNKSELFSKEGLTYIYELAAERSMNPLIVDDEALFDEYLYQTDISSKAMQWGKDQEPNARSLYMKKTNIEVIEIGFREHKTIPFFGSSPDGYCEIKSTKEVGTQEIKCIKQSTYKMFQHTVIDGKTLKKAEPKFFYQCQSHMMCTGANWTDFIAYNPFQSKPIHIARIFPDKETFDLIEERVLKANELIDKINK